MYISKPTWIGHLDERQHPVNIFSIDAHPDGTRLATGGLDTKVKIWNTAPIFKEHRGSEPEDALLCTLALHDGAVLCVRWSNDDGRFLASGSDDKIIVIWTLDATQGSFGGGVFGSLDGAQNLEHWKAIRRLVGHESDVTDLAWSPDNVYLASCGLDSKVIIWDGKTFEMIKTLTQHQGFVKGVTWDPAGKFLATQSDDKSVIIWRTNDWQAERVISDPYMNAAPTTFFRRLSWSPDGSQIATANAVNSGLPSAAVITRDTWRSDTHFVGHDAAIEVVRFNPRIFRIAKPTDDTTTVPFCTVCAVGSQDRSITFWTTPRPRPLLVARDVFQHSILDISWSQDGMTAFTCSFDGSVAVIQFDVNELGEPLTANEKDAYFSSLGLRKKAVRLAETPEQLALEEEHAVARATQSSSRLAHLMGDTHTGSIRQPHEASSGSSSSIKTAPTPSTPVQQRVTILPDGRKRIQPMLFSSSTGTPNRSSSVHAPPAPPTPGIRSRRESMVPFGGNEERASMRTDVLEVSPPSRVLPAGGLESVVVGQKRHRTNEDHGDVTNGEAKQPRSDAESRTASRPAFLAPELAVSAIRLSVPKVQATFSRSDVNQQAFVYECQNPISKKGAAKLTCSKHGNILWRQVLPSAILLLVASSVFCAAACEDGTIHIFSPAGRRMFPALCLNAPASFIDCNGAYLMCLTSVGLVYVWDVVKRKAILTNESISPLLFSEPVDTDEPTASVTITDARVLVNGVVVLCTSNGCAFAFDTDMGVWSRIVDAWYATSEFYTPVTGLLGQQATGGPLAMAQATCECTRTQAGRAMAGEALQSDRELHKLLVTSHLESQVASAHLLASATEYQHWILNYARRLASETALERAAELCRELFGPSYPKSKEASTLGSWSPTILGLSKHDLLRSVLPILANNRDLQRLAHEYTEALKQISRTHSSS